MYPLLTAEMPRAFPWGTLSENWEIHHSAAVNTHSGTPGGANDLYTKEKQ